MVEKQDERSLSRQCRLLSVGRTSVYYRPQENGRTLDLMRRIDELYTEDPTYGARRMCAALRGRGVKIGRYKVRRLMEKMGLEAIYRKPKLSEPHPDHKIYPYLLRGVTVTRVNQVWSTDITYIRLRHGFVYLTAVIDWVRQFGACNIAW